MSKTTLTAQQNAALSNFLVDVVRDKLPASKVEEARQLLTKNFRAVNRATSLASLTTLNTSR